jgi:molybdopterin molybdotransferase
MLDIDQALELVLQSSLPLPAQQLPLNAALGRTLAETIHSDVDSPPHDKSIVDGYALRAADVSAAGMSLNLLEEVTAGKLPTHHIVPGAATRVMTGAPLPLGADAVVMVEKCYEADDGSILINEFPVKAGQNIMRRGSSMKAGQGLLMPGDTLRAIEIGLLAEVGRMDLKVIPAPSVAILSTGDELVPVGEKPSAGKIRNSNECLLEALVKKYHATPIPLGIARDETDDLRNKIEQGLQHDVLVISGGVSAGVLDLVPRVLADLNVRQIFHKINLKPGKPLWFGLREESGQQRRCLVFGLPGNPVSSYICFELFVRPALGRLSAHDDQRWHGVTATLGNDYEFRGGRFTLHPVAVHEQGGKWIVTPLPWRGSGDLFGLSHADAVVQLAGEARTFKAGESVKIFFLN